MKKEDGFKDSIGTIRYYMEKPSGQEDWEMGKEAGEGEEDEMEGLDSYGPEETVLDDRKM